MTSDTESGVATKEWHLTEPASWSSACGLPGAIFYDENLESGVQWRKERVVITEDLFEPKVPEACILEAFSVMHASHNSFILKTRNIERAHEILNRLNWRVRKGNATKYGSVWEAYLAEKNAMPLVSVWLAAVVATQEEMDRALPVLLDTHTVGRTLWVEPLSEPILINNKEAERFVEWVVCGEGPLEWANLLKDWCRRHDKKFFYKGKAGKEWRQLPWQLFP